MSYTSKIFQQTFWQILGKVVTTFSTFIILGIVARNYGEENTGVFTLALTYLAIFYLLSDFGFNAHVLRNVAPSLKLWSVGDKTRMSNLKSEWQKLLGTRLVWSVALMIMAVGVVAFWPFVIPDFAKAVYFGGLTIVCSAIFVTCNLIFQKHLKYDLSVLAVSFGTLINLATFMILSSLKPPLYLLLLAHLIGWVAIALGALLLVRKFLHSVAPILNLQYTKNLFRESWPIAATLTLNVIYFRADSFMIAYFKSVSDVGIYNVAYSVFQSALVLPTFIMNSYYPLMLKSLGKFKYMCLALLGLAVFGTVATLVFAPIIIRILTGGGFNGSTLALQILSLGFPAYFLSSLLMWLLIAKGNYKQMLAIYTTGLVFNLILNFIFIPKYSFVAASWTTVISEYLILGLQMVIVGRKLL